MATKKKQTAKSKPVNPVLFLMVVLAATIVAWIPSVKNDFVNWDDIIYVMNNEMIQSFSWVNLQTMFTRFWMGNYHPLTIFSFAVDYNLFKLTPHGYHFHNLVLHIANTALLFLFTYHLTGKRTGVAAIVALLFAVHPMHVESVAWISERKDLLYTMWFLASMLVYVFYLKTEKLLWIGLSLFFFLLSLLSKAQAVTLPLALLVIDYFNSRKFGWKMVLEKVPFFFLSLVFGIVAVYAQQADNAVNAMNIRPFDSVFYGFYGLSVYLIKLVVPTGLTCLYEYPFTDTRGVPAYVYLSPITFLVLVGMIIYYRKRRPYISAGILFFLLTIFPMLQFLPVGQAVLAERYTYIPYIGLFLSIALGFFEVKERILPSSRRLWLTVGGILVILVFMAATWNRIAVWENSITLWTDVMVKNPRTVSAYINRGFIYNQDEYKEYNKALDDCNAGLKVDSNNYKLYINRGTAYRNLERYDLALDDFTRAIEKNPESVESYLDRGILYTDRFGEYDKGIADFNKYLTQHPDHRDATYNLGVAYYKKGSYDSALIYLNKVLAKYSDNASAHFVAAVIYGEKKDFRNAYNHGIKAKEYGYDVSLNLLNYWQMNVK